MSLSLHPVAPALINLLSMSFGASNAARFASDTTSTVVGSSGAFAASGVAMMDPHAEHARMGSCLSCEGPTNFEDAMCLLSDMDTGGVGVDSMTLETINFDSDATAGANATAASSASSSRGRARTETSDLPAPQPTSSSHGRAGRRAVAGAPAAPAPAQHRRRQPQSAGRAKYDGCAGGWRRYSASRTNSSSHTTTDGVRVSWTKTIKKTTKQHAGALPVTMVTVTRKTVYRIRGANNGGGYGTLSVLAAPDIPSEEDFWGY